MRTVMNRLPGVLRSAALLWCVLPAAQADVVIDWHDTAMTSFAQSGTPLLPATRVLAMTHAQGVRRLLAERLAIVAELDRAKTDYFAATRGSSF